VAGSRWRQSTDVYVAGAALGGLVAFIAATRMHGRRGGPGGASRALASAAFGWAAAIAAVIFAVATYAVVVTVMSGYWLIRSCAGPRLSQPGPRFQE
jgi:hypothetical protein